MRCCNINKSRRGGFFLVHLVDRAQKEVIHLFFCILFMAFDRFYKTCRKLNRSTDNCLISIQLVKFFFCSTDNYDVIVNKPFPEEDKQAVHLQ